MPITLFEGFRVSTTFEKRALIGVVVTAVLGLLYAAFLTRQILRFAHSDFFYYCYPTPFCSY